MGADPRFKQIRWEHLISGDTPISGVSLRRQPHMSSEEQDMYNCSFLQIHRADPLGKKHGRIGSDCWAISIGPTGKVGLSSLILSGGRKGGGRHKKGRRLCSSIVFSK